MNATDMRSRPKAPLYIQIQETLREMIEAAEFPSGSRIPSERELAQQFQVSRMTVRHALESLIEVGLLERRSTTGTYVRRPHLVRSLSSDSVQSLTRQIQGTGGQPGSKLLRFEKIRASRKVSEFLSLRLGSEVLCIRRQRLMNRLPFCVETSYLPFDRFPALSRAMLDGDASLYRILGAQYDVQAMRSIDTLSLSHATDEEAQLLDLQVDDPVIFLRSVVFDDRDDPFEYVISINHPYRVAFEAVTEIGNSGYGKEAA